MSVTGQHLQRQATILTTCLITSRVSQFSTLQDLRETEFWNWPFSAPKNQNRKPFRIYFIFLGTRKGKTQSHFYPYFTFCSREGQKDFQLLLYIKPIKASHAPNGWWLVVWHAKWEVPYKWQEENSLLLGSSFLLNRQEREGIKENLFALYDSLSKTKVREMSGKKRLSQLYPTSARDSASHQV